MKKIQIIFFLFTFIALGCSSEDSPAFDPNDWDADGVSNEKEYFDNTDPNNPCSLNISSQYPDIPESWKLLDCDGDGVTNKQETEDLTSSFNLCDFKIENQNLSLISEEWKNSDCDEDGVTNNQELIDETDLKDNCSFLVSSIELSPKKYWLELDCDNDGRTNEQEITDNTNPIDANDFRGKGDKIDFINYKGYTHHFTKNGKLYQKIIRNDNNFDVTQFEYDNQDNLKTVYINSEDEENITISFSYNNNLINKIVRQEGNKQEEYEVVYDTNLIYTYKDDIPNNLFFGKYTLDSNNKLVKEEHNYKSGVYSEENFNYKPNGDISNSNYTSGQYSGSFSYGTLENIKNPMKISCDNIYIPYILINEILSKSFYIKFGIFNTEFINYMDRNSPPTSHNFSYGVKNVQENGFPTLGYESDFSGTTNIEYYYKN